MRFCRDNINMTSSYRIIPSTIKYSSDTFSASISSGASLNEVKILIHGIGNGKIRVRSDPFQKGTFTKLICLGKNK
jgi:hypothetical protein